jgi:hypothetical protein
MSPEQTLQMRNDIEYKFEDDLQPGQQLLIESDGVTLMQGQNGLPVTYAVKAVKGNSVTVLGRWMYNPEEVQENWLKTAGKYKEVLEQRAKEQVEQMERDAAAPPEVLRGF